MLLKLCRKRLCYRSSKCLAASSQMPTAYAFRLCASAQTDLALSRVPKTLGIFTTAWKSGQPMGKRPSWKTSTLLGNAPPHALLSDRQGEFDACMGPMILTGCGFPRWRLRGVCLWEAMPSAECTTARGTLWPQRAVELIWIFHFLRFGWSFWKKQKQNKAERFHCKTKHESLIFNAVILFALEFCGVFFVFVFVFFFFDEGNFFSYEMAKNFLVWFSSNWNCWWTICIARRTRQWKKRISRPIVIYVHTIGS